jgi:hypothetical protein
MMGLFDSVKQFVSDVQQATNNLANTPPSPAGFAGSQSGPSPYQLADETVSVTLDGSGNGTARITPGQPASGGGVGASRNSGLTWDVTGCAVSVQPLAGHTAPVNEAQASTFISMGIQANGPNEFQGQTQTGSTGDTCSLAQTLRPGDWITTIWTGGDPGAIATMRIIGTVNPPGS